MVSFRRGRSDADCSLWRRAGDCAWQRALRARLDVGADAAHGGHPGRLKHSTCPSGEDECQRVDKSARTGNAGKCRKAGTRTIKRKSRRADRCARPEPEPDHKPNCGPNKREPEQPGLGRCSGIGCTGRGRCAAGTPGTLQCQRLHCRLSIFHGIGLHLSAEQWITPALHEVAITQSVNCSKVPKWS